MWEAQRAGVPIVVFVVTGRGFSAGEARALIEEIDIELPARNPGGASGESNLVRDSNVAGDSKFGCGFEIWLAADRAVRHEAVALLFA